MVLVSEGKKWHFFINTYSKVNIFYQTDAFKSIKSNFVKSFYIYSIVHLYKRQVFAPFMLKSCEWHKVAGVMQNDITALSFDKS